MSSADLVPGHRVDTPRGRGNVTKLRFGTVWVRLDRDRESMPSYSATCFDADDVTLLPIGESGKVPIPAMTHGTTAERLAEANNVLQIAAGAADAALMALDDKSTDALATQARHALVSFKERLAAYKGAL